MYSWQHPDWPKYEFSTSSHQAQLLKYSEQSGRLAAISELLSAQGIDQADIESLVDEAVNTSLIENEHLARDDVRSSIKHFMGLNPEIKNRDQRADGIVAALMDLREDVKSPLSHSRIKQWHAQVMYGNTSLLSQAPVAGEYRVAPEPMQIISGPIGRQTVHYEAPPAEQVQEEMSKFISWYNESPSLPAPVRAAVAHLWFETIHPFDDGNGRVGRAIAEHALAQGMGNMPPMSLSLALEKNKDQYYPKLHEASMGESLNIDKFVDWFAGQCIEAQARAQARFDMVIVKADFWRKNSDLIQDKSQSKVLNKFFDAGLNGFVHGLSGQKYAAISGCSRATASRHLAELTHKGVLVRLEGGGRSTRYAPNAQRLFTIMPSLVPHPIYRAVHALQNEGSGKTSDNLTLSLDALHRHLESSSVNPMDTAAAAMATKLISELDHSKLYNGKPAKDSGIPEQLRTEKIEASIKSNPINDYDPSP
jgi:Fic family protein